MYICALIIVNHFMSVQNFLFIINIVALLACVAWLISSPGWEPVITSLGVFGLFVGQLFKKESENQKTIMKQKGGKGSTNHQSGRDININSRTDDKR